MPTDPRKLRSQRLRSVNYQGDALRLGMNWTEEDLDKPVPWLRAGDEVFPGDAGEPITVRQAFFFQGP